MSIAPASFSALLLIHPTARRHSSDAGKPEYRLITARHDWVLFSSAGAQERCTCVGLNLLCAEIPIPRTTPLREFSSSASAATLHRGPQRHDWCITECCTSAGAPVSPNPSRGSCVGLERAPGRGGEGAHDKSKRSQDQMMVVTVTDVKQRKARMHRLNRLPSRTNSDDRTRYIL